MLNPCPVVIVLGASPPLDHLSFHMSTQPVALGLSVLTTYITIGQPSILLNHGCYHFNSWLSEGERFWELVNFLWPQ